MQTKARREFAATWYRMKVFGNATSDVKEFVGELGDRYDMRQAYEKAHARNNPYLSAHGFLRKLQFGDNAQAQEFLETFGPLKLPLGTRLRGMGPVVVNLNEFWGLQRRFCLIANAWESLNDRLLLSHKLLNIYNYKNDQAIYQEFPLGQIFGPPPKFERRGQYDFPWGAEPQEARTWLRSAPLAQMRACAVQLILLELSAHTQALRIVWDRSWDPSGIKFREAAWLDSLWSAVWECWGQDTSGLPWRQCPHCQTFFYPKRQDQFYCTPRQQALWSKRRYAAERRAEERKRDRNSR
jgi:hypothetical protein